MSTAALSDRQACLLRHLYEHGHCMSCAAAGDVLQSRGLLAKASAYASNLALPGSSVLRSLERRGLVTRLRVGSTYDRYALTAEGRDLARTLPPA